MGSDPAQVTGQRSIARVRLLQRIHVRLTLIYGAALLVILTPAAILVHNFAVQSELDSLYARLKLTTVALASLVDGDRVAAMKSADDPYRHELLASLHRVQATQEDIAALYLFAPTARPETMRFVLDTDTREEPGAFGEEYNATPYPELRAGLHEPTVEREPVSDRWGLSVSGFAPVFDRFGKPVAILGADVDAARVEQMKERLRNLAILTYLGAVVLLVLAAIGVARIVRGPMIRVIEATEQIADGHLEARVSLARPDEFGVLGRHFDTMAAGLEEREHIRATFGRYVSEDVAKKLLADRHDGIVRGEQRFVTVLFTDLRGYSTLSAHLDPSQVLTLMNHYLEAMSAVIDAHDGCIIEYLGDGVLTVFGAPEDVPNHPERAVRCALAMNERLVLLNEELDRMGMSALWKRVGIERLTAKTGIHCGPVVAGSLGSRVRMKYAVLGDAVNLAARLEALNATLRKDVLVSGDLLEQLPPELKSRFRSEGRHMIKGRPEPVEVFSLDLNMSSVPV